MSGVNAISDMHASQTSAAIAIRALQMANDQQQAAASLVGDAAELAQEIVEQGIGELVDMQA